VEDTYLSKQDEFVERRIRRRGQNDSYSYLLFETKLTNDNIIETKRRIKSREYLSMYELRDKERRSIKKSKCTFVWNNITYNIEKFEIPDNEFVQCIL